MKPLLASTALAIALAAAPAYAQQPPTPETAQGQITVQGAEPSEVETTVAAPEAPQPNTTVIIDTEVRETPSATVETTTEIITPVSDRPALNPENPIAPEVQAVIDTKKNYTTADIAKAQHEATLATPVSQPTTIVTTTTTTPRPGG